MFALNSFRNCLRKIIKEHDYSPEDISRLMSRIDDVSVH
jgi:hypothetical protein